MKNILKIIGFLILCLDVINATDLDFESPEIQKLLQKDNELYSQGVLLYQQGKYEASLPYIIESFSIRKYILKDNTLAKNITQYHHESSKTRQYAQSHC